MNPTRNVIREAQVGISFPEAHDVLLQLRPVGAPGPSGLSYNMIKAWPEHVRQIVYECLCELWQDRAAPQHWKWRFLVPIPKKESPTLNDVRPLMLVEALQKIWTSICVVRIQGFGFSTGSSKAEAQTCQWSR